MLFVIADRPMIQLLLNCFQPQVLTRVHDDGIGLYNLSELFYSPQHPLLTSEYWDTILYAIGPYDSMSTWTSRNNHNAIR